MNIIIYVKIRFEFANFINNPPSTLIVPFGTCSSGLQGTGAGECPVSFMNGMH